MIPPRFRTPSPAAPLAALLTLLVVSVVASASAQEMAQEMATESVTFTVTNTSPQIISPPILISHGSDFLPVTLGGTADPELVLLAEDGDNSELATVAAVQPSVLGVTSADGPLMPGDSVELTVEVSESAHFVTLLGMLVTTNDALAFWGYDVNAMAMTGETMGESMEGETMGDAMGDAMTLALYDGVVRVLDAGSEANTETCAYIPGPPCGSAGERPMEPGEGAIALHGGILGVGELDPAEWDWTNPVLTVETGMGM